MGDRANIFIRDTDDTGVYLYSHWNGSNLGTVLRNALKRGRDRWDDAQYLARIVFCEMIRNEDLDDTTGYGITARTWDGDTRVIKVDPDTKTIGLANSNETWTFETFCDLSDQRVLEIWD